MSQFPVSEFPRLMFDRSGREVCAVHSEQQKQDAIAAGLKESPEPDPAPSAEDYAEAGKALDEASHDGADAVADDEPEKPKRGGKKK